MLGLGDALGLLGGSSYPGSTTNLTGCTDACRYCEYVPEMYKQLFIIIENVLTISRRNI